MLVAKDKNMDVAAIVAQRIESNEDERRQLYTKLKSAIDNKNYEYLFRIEILCRKYEKGIIFADLKEEGKTWFGVDFADIDAAAYIDRLEVPDFVIRANEYREFIRRLLLFVDNKNVVCAQIINISRFKKENKKRLAKKFISHLKKESATICLDMIARRKELAKIVCRKWYDVL